MDEDRQTQEMNDFYYQKHHPMSLSKSNASMTETIQRVQRIFTRFTGSQKDPLTISICLTESNVYVTVNEV